MAKINLQKREKLVLAAGAVALAIILGVHLGRGPLRAYQESKEQLRATRLNLALMQQWHDEIRTARAGREALDRHVRARGAFDLWTHINNALRSSGVHDRGSFEERRSPLSGELSEVQLNLEEVSIDELLDVLHGIYDGRNLIVLYRLNRLQPARSGKGLSCEMTFVTPKRL